MSSTRLPQRSILSQSPDKKGKAHSFLFNFFIFFFLVIYKTFPRKDKKGEENGCVHTRAGSKTRFSTSLEIIEADEYDRRSEKTWVKLTATDKALIREELNLYKSNEMKVHEDSRQYTR